MAADGLDEYVGEPSNLCVNVFAGCSGRLQECHDGGHSLWAEAVLQRGDENFLVRLILRYGYWRGFWTGNI